MSKCRFLVSVLAISLGVLVVEPFSSLDTAFAQSVEEAAQLNEQAIQLYQQGRYADTSFSFSARASDQMKRRLVPTPATRVGPE